ncbi:MAG: MerR family transcriptional regulator [Firmicutes bacterium]|nr:MerR family transcriptional regulator [Bacillota bacterium]
MDIDNEKEYSISEVSELTGYEKHVLRYYEKEFELDIPRNEANHRYFTYKEIEVFNNIKSLQDKGFTNKQIKLILNSPEVIVDDNQESAVTTNTNNQEQLPVDINKLSESIRQVLINEVAPTLVEKQNDHLDSLNDVKKEIQSVKEEIRSKERDILICENAKLKMKVKEKSYELAEYKEKLKREKNNNKGLFKKIFRLKK